MCTSPLHIKNPAIHLRFYDPKFIDVPCGQCLECQQSKQRDWTVRALAHIRKYHRLGFQVFYYTLTYNDEHLPLVPCIVDDVKVLKPCFSKKDVQKFLCSLRTYLSRKYSLTFTYFVVSEYGHLHNRPHYHILFFIDGCIDPREFKKIVTLYWSFKETIKVRKTGSLNGFVNSVRYHSLGFVKPGNHLGLVSPGSEFPVFYCVKYLCKDFDENYDYVQFLLNHFDRSLLDSDSFLSEYTLKPFHLQSCGFGLSILDDENFDKDSMTYKYFDCHEDDDSKHLIVSVPVPRYISLHFHYDKYINKNGNVSYRLNDIGKAYKISKISEKIEDFKKKIFDFDLYDFSVASVNPYLFTFLQKFHGLCFSDIIKSICGSIDFLAEYNLLYKFRSTFGLAHNVVSDMEIFLSSDFPFDPVDYSLCIDKNCDFALSLINVFSSCVKYHSYVDRTEKFNISQRLKSSTSSDLKLVKIVDYPTYCSTKLKFIKL